MKPLKYRYKGNWLLVIAIIIFSSLATYFYYIKSLNNDVGLIINNIIELNAFQATIFYWFLFTCSVLFLLTGLFITYFNITSKDFLFLHEDKITIPPSTIINRKTTEILYSNIISIQEVTVSSNTFLTIEHSEGKKNITKSMLPSKKDYKFIKQFIENKI